MASAAVGVAAHTSAHTSMAVSGLIADDSPRSASATPQERPCDHATHGQTSTTQVPAETRS
jgi:hypothetical protein